MAKTTKTTVARYHPRFRQMRDEVKYSRLPAVEQALERKSVSSFAARAASPTRSSSTTPASRKAYIHPAIFAAYMDGKPIATDEAGVAAMIGRRLRKTA